MTYFPPFNHFTMYSEDSETTASDGTGSRERSDNKIFAEFMGWQYQVVSGPLGGDVEQVRKTHRYWSIGCSTYLSWTSPKFDASWEWLMDACKKWDALPFLDHGELMRYQIDLCNKLDGAVTQYEIEPAFRQLVENIRWYNNQKQQSS